MLFLDLVGFTTLSEGRDPEEVRDLLSRYFDRCRTLIERYSGTVEKFIGDAVMAVWGAPVAREDDAERAVRAALALIQTVAAVGEQVGISRLTARAGVLTGRAAVDLGAIGEGMVLGDTVNTASRLQTLASPGTVLVDDVTRRASEDAIAFEDAGAHQVKGRERPVRVWTALRVVAGARGARRGVGLEPLFVGRDRELEIVIESSEASARQRGTRLVTVIGEAGAGKSRLLWEFFKYVDGIDEVRWWHRGRCLAYGEGVAYWALAEMVRARAGILEEEDPGSARSKLRAVVEEYVVDERERRLVEPRLAHLLGLEHRNATEAADLFSGWRLFFERMAERNPVILAFEDLQWADSGLLEFIDYLLEWSAGHPVFVLALGRPELEARRRDWGTPVRLAPLGLGAMQALLESVVPGLPSELRGRILERAEGVPLYAVETVRMLLDRQILTEQGQRYVVSSDVADLEVPETLHALVAARLDDLDVNDRGLLQDAAVLGMSFAPAALAAVSARPESEVRAVLDALVTKQVLGRDDDPRLAEPGQYHFLQALLRTVALQTLARRERKARHLAAAEYLSRTSNDGPDIAEVLASHYLSAIDADPDAHDVQAIRAAARQTLAAAGHRAVSLALGVEARGYFEQAAALADNELEQAQLLADAGVAAARAGDTQAARTLLRDAITVLDAHERPEDAARTRVLLANLLIEENLLEAAVELLDDARPALSDEAALGELAARRARVAFLRGDYGRALVEADVALGIVDPRKLWPVIAEAVITKGTALWLHGRLAEAGALLRFGLETALDHDVPDQALRGYFNVAEERLVSGHPERSGDLLEHGLKLARERGNRPWERDLLAQRIGVHAYCGEWDEALGLSEQTHTAGQTGIVRLGAVFVAPILAARADRTALEGWLAEPTEESAWHELALIERVAKAVVQRALGQSEQARASLVAAAPDVVSLNGLTQLSYIGEILDVLLEDEQGTELLDQLLAQPIQGVPMLRAQFLRATGRLHARQGRLAEAEAALTQAIATLSDAGNPFEHARALVDQGTVLLESGREGEAIEVLRAARARFARLGATPWIERIDVVVDVTAAEHDSVATVR